MINIQLDKKFSYTLWTEDKSKLNHEGWIGTQNQQTSLIVSVSTLGNAVMLLKAFMLYE